MKKLILVIVVALTFSLSACGSNGSSASPAAKASNKMMNINTLPPSLDGKWITSNPTKDVNFEADISDDHITIMWAAIKDDDTTALYWEGTFPAGSSEIVSQGDVDKMSASLLASSDKVKKFKYDNGQLSFPFSMMGINTTVHLKKVTT